MVTEADLPDGDKKSTTADFNMISGTDQAMIGTRFPLCFAWISSYMFFALFITLLLRFKKELLLQDEERKEVP